MVVRRWFEWDVLTHPSPHAWFDELSAQGWTRVPGRPGAPTPQGTVAYEFEHPGPASDVEPDPGSTGSGAVALILVASGIAVIVIVVAVLVVIEIAMS